MTKYILVGGNDLQSDNYGTQLAQEIYKSVEARPVRILSCLFATPPEFQPIAAKTWRPWFERHFGKDIVWSYALPERFEEQVRATDVLYLHGGDNNLLLETLGNYLWFPAALGDRIVVGSSAGANYLSKHFWTRRKQQISQGSGILPLSVMVHYGADDPDAPKTDWEWAEERLGSLSDGMLVKIREGHFWIVEQ